MYQLGSLCSCVCTVTAGQPGPTAQMFLYILSDFGFELESRVVVGIGLERPANTSHSLG